MFCHAGKPTLPFNVFVCIGLILGAAFGLNACKPRPQALRFETIDQSDAAFSGLLYKSSKPSLIVIAQPQEVDSLIGLINENAKEKIRTLDYSRYFAVLVLQGYKPSLGYGVNITEIMRLQNNVIVYVDFTEVRPDTEAAAVVSSPYHLVRVEKAGSWSQDITFDLIVHEFHAVFVSHFIP